MTRDYQRPHRFDASGLAAAEIHYAQHGYQPVAVPWVISEAAYRATQPDGSEDYATLGGYLAASGEQSLLQLMMDDWELPPMVQCITPCFRSEHHDPLHAPYFMKLELMVPEPKDSIRQLTGMREAAELFFDRRVGHLTELTWVLTAEGWDLETAEGIELGSYGVRRHGAFTWIYGTGLAQPRTRDATQAAVESHHNAR